MFTVTRGCPSGQGRMLQECPPGTHSILDLQACFGTARRCHRNAEPRLNVAIAMQIACKRQLGRLLPRPTDLIMKTYVQMPFVKGESRVSPAIDDCRHRFFQRNRN